MYWGWVGLTVRATVRVGGTVRARATFEGAVTVGVATMLAFTSAQN